MDNILAVFFDALLAGLLADNDLLNDPRQLDDLETALAYERWRIAFMAGKAHLETARGEIVTLATVAKAQRGRQRRRDKIWKLRFYGRG